MTTPMNRPVLATFVALSLGVALAVPAEAVPTLGKRKACVIDGVSHSPKICAAIEKKNAQATLGKRKSQRCVINGLEFSAAICKAHKAKKEAEAKKQAEELARVKAEQDAKRARKEARREALKDAFVELVKRAAQR